MIKHCQLCSREFRARHTKNRFCSRHCAVRGRCGRTRKVGILCECSECGADLIRRRSQLRLVQFCNIDCKAKYDSRKYQGELNPNFQDAGRRTCEGCGSQYHSYDSERRFCSVSCSQSLTRSEYLANVQSGKIAELECADILRSSGCSVYISPNSRGPFDVYAERNGVLYCIQVKYSRHSRMKKQREYLEALWDAAAPSGAKKELWFKSEVEGWQVFEAV